jgi:sucrose-6-phosphate hydrolase SacC (GH32 family)
MKRANNMKLTLALLTALLLAPLAGLRAAEAVGKAALHYQPPDSFFGDPIPFFHEGVHHVFYLHTKKTMNWYHLASRDLVHWEELPPAILADENDAGIATGSIVEQAGVFHAFYTTSQVGDQGAGSACVRVATSRDLVQWTKQPGPPLLLLRRDVPAVGTYDPFAHWRDPHVFWNPKAGEWWLAIAAHEKTDLAYPYAGAVALATSKDLRNWTVRREPLLATREIVASECPDIFPFGTGWAMTYYTDTTRLRLADKPDGPWRRPVNDAPWGLHFQAGKTEFDGSRHIVHAYLQRADSDYAEHVYGGCMALPRELFLDARGEVCTRLVPEVAAACREDATGGKGATVFTTVQGDPVTAGETALTLAAKMGATALALWKEAPADLFLTADVKLSRGATLNLLLRGKAQKDHPARVGPSPLDDSYVLSLDAHTRQVTLTRHNAWNRTPALRVQSLDLPTDRAFKLHLMLHGNVLEVFVDDRISLCARVQFPDGALALLARDGQVTLDNFRIKKVP